MIGRTAKNQSLGTLRLAVAALALAVVAVATGSARANATPPEQAQCCFEVMTYNVYLGANLQPLFGKSGDELIEEAAKVFVHIDKVDFNLRAVAIARQIVQAEPEVVGLQELSLWQTAPATDPSQVTTKSDYLQILLDELERQGHPYRAVSVNPTFHAELLISDTALGKFTDRNAIIARADLPASEVETANAREGVYRTTLPVPIGDTTIQITRGWASVDVSIRGSKYRVFDTHLEGFHPLVRLGQAGELVALMSGSPYPVVLAGDLNLYPQGLRSVDDQAWSLLIGAGFVDSWVEADESPAFTAGQPDDLDCTLPSTLDNMVDFVLHDADGTVDAVRHSGDIVGEDPGDCTTGTPPLWPSDHAGVVVALHLPEA